MEATYLSKDNDWKNGSTTYWFNVNYTNKDGEDLTATMGVAESGCDDAVIVVIIDNKPCPIYESEAADYYLYADLVNCVTDEMRKE